MPKQGAALRKNIDGQFVATLAVGVVAILVGIWIPWQIDRAAAERDRVGVCASSVLSLREAMLNLEAGYSVAPDATAERVRDWSAGKAAIDRVDASCWAVDARRPRLEEAERAFGQYDCDYNVKLGAHCTSPSVAADGRSSGRSSGLIIDWTTGAVKNLTA